MNHQWDSWCQWNYVRYNNGKYEFYPRPMFIVYAKTIMEADTEFKRVLGTSPAKLPHVGVRWNEVTHVGLPDKGAGAAISEQKGSAE